VKIGIHWHWQVTPASTDEVIELKRDIFLDNATKVDVLWNNTQNQLLFFCDGTFGTLTLEHDEQDKINAEREQQLYRQDSRP
jgi:hypothetical protein